MRDISERKLAEDRIKELLHEKDLLLKETHHRVRNNLNTVYSLLNLRAESALAGYDRNSLAEAAGSVKAMLLLYNRLYVSPDYTEIRLSVYLEGLVKEILEGFTGIVSVKTAIEIPDIRLKPVVLSSIGIITNELLTNSVKYAFRGRRKGNISIKAELLDNTLVLEYADDGPGFAQITADALPSSPDFGNFGLKLVMALVRQLHGTLQLDNSDGALCRMRIPVE